MNISNQKIGRKVGNFVVRVFPDAVNILHMLNRFTAGAKVQIHQVLVNPVKVPTAWIVPLAEQNPGVVFTDGITNELLDPNDKTRYSIPVTTVATATVVEALDDISDEPIAEPVAPVVEETQAPVAEVKKPKKAKK